MAEREERSVSLSADLAYEIDQAAAEGDTTFSGWLAETAARRLRPEAGKRAIADWEHGHGALTAEELTDGLARARALLGPRAQRKGALPS